MQEYCEGISSFMAVQCPRNIAVISIQAGIKMNKIKYKKALLQAMKIAVGSSFSIYLAGLMNYKFAASAGTVTLLTVVSTKWDTLRLSAWRLLSFGISAVLAGILFQIIEKEWVAFGSYIFLVVIICGVMEWNAAISVNAVIGTHFLAEKDFTYGFIRNEFGLVAIGIVVALVLNLFHGNNSQKKYIIKNIEDTEERLRMILGELAAYLDNRDMQRDVWADICLLEEKLRDFSGMSYEYQENTFYSHPQYYIDYFEMRAKQCSILHNLHNKMKKIRSIPKQAEIISRYILYMMDFITEENIPEEQIKELDKIFDKMKHEPLPQSRGEFENRALLYHILMDLEEFLALKKRFVESLDGKKIKIYWKGKFYAGKN